MKFLFASDSFKGSLTSEQTIELLARAANDVFDDVTYEGVWVADGGEGTTEAVIHADNGKKIYTSVHGPLMEEEQAFFGVTGDKAILEMAAASGLPMVPKDKRNPLYTTTYGTGELILAAIDKGYRDITIALGGSATNDGGIGCLKALGVEFYDKDHQSLEGKGEDLIRISHIDTSNMDKRLKECTFTIMSDVTNPLCGKDGATYTFGPQKGATDEILEQLEAGMCNYRDIIKKQFGIDCDTIPGTGAAGGLGAALTVFLHASIKSGIQAVLDLIHFDDRLEGVDLVVTGEGRTDWQSCFGKVMQGVGLRAKKAGIPAVGLCGSLGKGAEQIFDHGITSLITTVNAPMSLDEAMENAESLYYLAAVRMFRMIQAGMQIQANKN
ncbi:MAG: glycerate kinase [Faecalicoccus sp.]|nr:glycerate kinase [Faecalicoccus sp.]